MPTSPWPWDHPTGRGKAPEGREAPRLQSALTAGKPSLIHLPIVSALTLVPRGLMASEWRSRVTALSSLVKERNQSAQRTGACVELVARCVRGTRRWSKEAGSDPETSEAVPATDNSI